MRVLRITAGVLSVGSLATAILLQGRLMGRSITIGAWTGLPGYERLLRDAIADYNFCWYWFVVSQIAGGIVTALAFAARAGHPVRWVAWVPLSIPAFYILTSAMFWLLAIAAGMAGHFWGR